MTIHLFTGSLPSLQRLSSRKGQPLIESNGTFLATATRFNPYGVSDSFDRVAQTDFLLDQKPGKPYTMEV
jgi:hypothetical protein